MIPVEKTDIGNI